jgi:hypothetical protein
LTNFPFQNSTFEEVNKHAFGPNKHEGTLLYPPLQRSLLLKEKTKGRDHLVRINPAYYLGSDWYYSMWSNFLPAVSNTYNMVAFLTSDIPMHLANIFNENHNGNLTIHPEVTLFNKLYTTYKKLAISRQGIPYNSDYTNALGIIPNGDPNSLSQKILAAEDAGTKRAFLSDSVLTFKDFKEEYDFLKREVEKNHQPLAKHITTSDITFLKDTSSSLPLVYSLNLISDKPEYITFEVHSNKPAYFVLLDLFDSGWSVYVNNVKSTIYRGYIGTRFIKTPEGRSIITFKYRIPWLFWGCGLSLITCVFGFFLLSFRSKPRTT